MRGRDRGESPHRGPRRTRSRRAEPTLAIALILASCTASSVPRPRFPQVEQATEALQGGGERYRTHRACAGAAKSVDDLVRCMQDAGWTFVARGPAYPEADCWQAHDRGEVDRIPPQCFVRSPEHAGEVAP